MISNDNCCQICFNLVNYMRLDEHFNEHPSHKNNTKSFFFLHAKLLYFILFGHIVSRFSLKVLYPFQADIMSLLLALAPASALSS